MDSHRFRVLCWKWSCGLATAAILAALCLAVGYLTGVYGQNLPNHVRELPIVRHVAVIMLSLFLVGLMSMLVAVLVRPEPKLQPRRSDFQSRLATQRQELKPFGDRLENYLGSHSPSADPDGGSTTSRMTFYLAHVSLYRIPAKSASSIRLILERIRRLLRDDG